jgi:glycosyltransferase involved in cell wall biosynthesis
MDRLPSVSVIVPAYKASGTIGRALDSALGQTHPADEIVVVDDGSPDDLAAAVARFGSRVRLMRKPNGGAASARNFGIEHSRGEVIAFLDADDHWEPHKLEKQLAIFKQHAEVGLLASSFWFEFPGKEERKDFTVPERFQDRPLRLQGREAFAAAMCSFTSTVLLRRAVLGDQRFDTTLATAEDRDLWIRMIQKSPVYLISDRLASHVLTSGSLSRRDLTSDYPNMLTVIHRYRDLLGRGGVRVHEALVYRNWAAGHLRAGQMRQALSPAWQRLIRQPWSLQAWWIVAKSALGTATSSVGRKPGEQGASAPC